MNDAKPWYKSLTLWFNAGVILISLGEFIHLNVNRTFISDPELLALLVTGQSFLIGLGNYIIRRFRTDSPIS